MGTRDYSTTAASNLSVGGISLAEGMARSSVNNGMRQQLADIADLLLDLGGATTTTGSANAYLLALDSAPSAYSDNLLFLAKLNHMNSGASTLSVNGIGPKDVKKFIIGSTVPAAVDPGDLHVGHVGIFVYSSAANAFMLLNPTTSEMIGTNIAIFETRTAAEAAHLPASVNMLETLSFATPGDGAGARYKRITGPSVYQGDFDSADGAWWEHAPSGVLRAAEYGVVGGASLSGAGVWSGTDQEPAIKDASFRHAYLSKGGPMELPIGNLYLGRGIHLGYGDVVRGGRLRGAQRGQNAADYPATTLVWNFTDEPLLSIQGVRSSIVEDVSFYGPGVQYLFDANMGSYGYSEATAGDDTLIATWYPPAWRGVQATSRYAPSAVIAIDPRVGPPSPSSPTSVYRDVDYPVAMGAVSQYGKTYSSAVTIQNFSMYGGGSVGIVVQPNENSDGNGDFVRIRNANIYYLPIGLSVSQTQARLTLLDGVDFARCHTCVTTNTHGRQQGIFSEAHNCHLQGIQAFDFGDMAVSGTVVFEACYGEELWRIGDFVTASSSTTKLSMNQCKLGFSSQNESLRGVPATMIGKGGGMTPLEINGGCWTYFYGCAVINKDVRGITIEDLFLDPAPPASKQHMCFLNGTGGGLVFPQLGFGLPIENIHPKFVTSDLDAGTSSFARKLGRVWQSSRTICTPLWVQRHGASTLRDEGVFIPERTQPIAAGSTFTGPSMSGLTLTTTWGGRSDMDYMISGPLPGDILYHPATSSTFVCMTANTTTDVVTFRLLNNFKNGNVPRSTIDFVVDTTFYLGSLRYYSPNLPVYGIITYGSAVITEAGRFPQGGGAQLGVPASDVAVGDWLIVDPSLAPYLNQALCNVTAVNTGAATITLDGAGAVIASSTTRVRLGTFVRPGVF